MNIIAKLHADWSAKSVPPGASPAQRKDLERAFYSGFIACLVHQLTHIGAIENDDEAVAQLDEIQQEAENYFHPRGQTPPETYRHPRL